MLTLVTRKESTLVLQLIKMINFVIVEPKQEMSLKSNLIEPSTRDSLQSKSSFPLVFNA